jgi:hypothetical protein
MIWQGLNQMWFCVMDWVIWTNWHWLVMGVLGRLVPTYGSWFFSLKAHRFLLYLFAYKTSTFGI